jgi:hypothetical protein
MPVRSAVLPKLPAAFALLGFAGLLPARAQLLPVMPPTTSAAPGTTASPVPAIGTPTHTTAPLAAMPDAATQPGERPRAAQVSCQNGMLEVHADNSSLNSILRAVSRCTGMRVTGGVSEQRVFGNYGPAAPATVLATLIDGTGSNMLLKETAADQPAELILTPRTGGPTPPSPASYAENDAPDQGNAPSAPQPLYPGQQPPYNVPRRGMMRPGLPANGTQPGVQNNMADGQNGGQPQNSNQTPVPPPAQGSMVTSPPSIPQPTNNVNGSPSNTSYTAGTYPTTDSRPLDSVATPSTTPSTNGIVDAPNPPPAGSDTAAVLNGAPQGTPGTTNINPNATSQTTTPGATNTTLPASNTANQQNNGQPNTDLTPEQIFAQLQQRQQQQQQRQQQQNNPTPQDQTQQNNPQ